MILAKTEQFLTQYSLFLTILLSLFFWVSPGQTATVTAHTGMQSSRTLQPASLHIFSKQKTSISLEFAGLCEPVYGIRVTLRQITSRLAVPLAVLHEEVSKNNTPLPTPSKIEVHLTLPELSRRGDFELVSSVRYTADNQWTVIDTSPITAYPDTLFSQAAQFKEFTFVLLDKTKSLQQLFTAESIPFIDFWDNPDGIISMDNEKILLALCNLPDEQDRQVSEYALELKEVADHTILIKQEKQDLPLLLIKEQENRMEIRVTNSMLTDLSDNPASQNRLLTLIERIADFSQKQITQ